MHDAQPHRTQPQILYYIVSVAWLAFQRGLISAVLAFTVVFYISVHWYVSVHSIHNLAVYKWAQFDVSRDRPNTPLHVYTMSARKIELPAFMIIVDPYQRALAERTVSKLSTYTHIGAVSGSFAMLFGFAAFVRGFRR